MEAVALALRRFWHARKHRAAGNVIGIDPGGKRELVEEAEVAHVSGVEVALAVERRRVATTNGTIGRLERSANELDGHRVSGPMYASMIGRVVGENGPGQRPFLVR